jgi:hypothetical protein
MLRKINIHIQKVTIDIYFHLSQKLTQNRSQSKCKMKKYKPLKDNIRENLSDLEFGGDFHIKHVRQERKKL